MENEGNYNIDSDDMTNAALAPMADVSVPKVLTMEDFEELKRKTLDLVDPERKRSRNEELLGKMLALDAPIITQQMAEFCTAKVCALLLSYVTQRNNGLLAWLSRTSPRKNSRWPTK